mmetsp:Transcript_11837/g.27275  ORF Transcript_11837/g.27275 Transcript_11837/m.27275 type:complete len:309 (-) Transcript_11837:108-1034(-)
MSSQSRMPCLIASTVSLLRLFPMLFVLLPIHAAIWLHTCSDARMEWLPSARTKRAEEGSIMSGQFIWMRSRFLYARPMKESPAQSMPLRLRTGTFELIIASLTVCENCQTSCSCCCRAAASLSVSETIDTDVPPADLVCGELLPLCPPCKVAGVRLEGLRERGLREGVGNSSKFLILSRNASSSAALAASSSSFFSFAFASARFLYSAASCAFDFFSRAGCSLRSIIRFTLSVSCMLSWLSALRLTRRLSPPPRGSCFITRAYRLLSRSMILALSPLSRSKCARVLLLRMPWSRSSDSLTFLSLSFCS